MATKKKPTGKVDTKAIADDRAELLARIDDLEAEVRSLSRRLAKTNRRELA